MDFRPRHSHPFTFQQAIGFDVSVINEEIARLQNSIAHLKDTQDLIRKHLASEGPDRELATAFSENETVIASQQERISILQFTLREKGVINNDHYAPSSLAQPSPQPNTSISNEDIGVDL